MWRVVPRATATGGAWIHAPPPMKVTETGGSGTSSSSLSPYAGSDLQQQQKRNNQLILVFISFVFEICFVLFSSSRFAVRGCCCWGGRRTDLSLWAPLCSGCYWRI
jgi:hypothetical protein